MVLMEDVGRVEGGDRFLNRGPRRSVNTVTVFWGVKKRTGMRLVAGKGDDGRQGPRESHAERHIKKNHDTTSEGQRKLKGDLYFRSGIKTTHDNLKIRRARSGKTNS